MLLVSAILLVAQQHVVVSQTCTNEYDFIIVGGGTAGATVANRLSEINHWRILLLEVGPEPSNLTDIPAFAGTVQFPQYNWNYTWEPQDNIGKGMVDGRMTCPSGKVLGGSSILNFMIHVRGNRFDYDGWESLGNEGWSYEEVLPYFKKSEDYQVVLQDEGYHSKGGYLGVEDVSYRSQSSYAFVSMMNSSNYPILDYNGRQQYGVSHLHATTRKGHRSSSVRAFLDPVRSRENLEIITEAQVTRIIIASRKARGVEVIIGGERMEIKARKEVILSAGALNSPQILMLSGIGPREHLEDLGIPVVKDLPIGQTLQEHLAYAGLTFLVNDTSFTFDPAAFMDPAAFAEWMADGTGPLSSPGAVEALAFVKTDASTHPDPLFPDMEFIYVGLSFHNDGGSLKQLIRISDDMYNNYWKPYEGQPGFTIVPMLFHPRSHGNLSLTSKDPNVPPKFYGNFLTDPENFDLKTLVAAIRKAIDIVHTSPEMQKVNARLIGSPVPGCESYETDSDQYWECALRHLGVALFHPTGTSKMGPKCDPEAVVDDRLRVHGIKSLRVVDAGIIPVPLSAHTNVPTYMIAEKAADMIKQDWGWFYGL